MSKLISSFFHKNKKKSIEIKHKSKREKSLKLEMPFDEAMHRIIRVKSPKKKK